MNSPSTNARPRFTLSPREYLDDPARKRALNEALFKVVAPEYDRVTRALSFGRDQIWKDALVAGLPSFDAPAVLDLACGTGDLTRRLAARYPRGRIIGLDLTPAMVERARALVSGEQIEYRIGDLGRTGLPSSAFEVVTGGYALRNAADLHEALREVHRLLRFGGAAAFLDFSKSPRPASRRFALWLLRVWGGAFGLFLHGRPAVYGYIAESLARFPDRERLAKRYREAGLEVLRARRFFFGLVEIQWLRKPLEWPTP